MSGLQERSQSVRTLNSLLRGELLAVESYAYLIPRLADGRPTDVEALRRMQRHHRQAVQRIRQDVRRFGGEPDESSGVWPALVKTVEGPAKVFADAAALVSLKEVETDRLAEYSTAIVQLDEAAGAFVSEVLIPALHKHIAELDGMVARL